MKEPYSAPRCKLVYSTDPTIEREKEIEEHKQFLENEALARRFEHLVQAAPAADPENVFWAIRKFDPPKKLKKIMNTQGAQETALAMEYLGKNLKEEAGSRAQEFPEVLELMPGTHIFYAAYALHGASAADLESLAEKGLLYYYSDMAVEPKVDPTKIYLTVSELDAKVTEYFVGKEGIQTTAHVFNRTRNLMGSDNLNVLNEAYEIKQLNPHWQLGHIVDVLLRFGSRDRADGKRSCFDDIANFAGIMERHSGVKPTLALAAERYVDAWNMTMPVITDELLLQPLIREQLTDMASTTIEREVLDELAVLNGLPIADLETRHRGENGLPISSTFNDGTIESAQAWLTPDGDGDPIATFLRQPIAPEFRGKGGEKFVSTVVDPQRYEQWLRNRIEKG